MGLAKHFYTAGGIKALQTNAERAFFGLKPKKVTVQKIKSLKKSTISEYLDDLFKEIK